MSSKKQHFAIIQADEKLDFPFPYDGGSTAELTVRDGESGNEALLSVSKGQFTNVTDGYIKIRFDDAPAVKFSTSAPSSGSTNVIL